METFEDIIEQIDQIKIIDNKTISKEIEKSKNKILDFTIVSTEIEQNKSIKNEIETDQKFVSEFKPEIIVDKKVNYISVPKAGGFDQLKLRVQEFPTNSVTNELFHVPEEDLVIVQSQAIGVNYADVCVRWGLYDSAKKYVGWPITPGFEYSGIVVKKGLNVKNVNIGDEVFGITLFGGYSSQIQVPYYQLFKRPKQLQVEEAAGFCAVALTAWYAIDLANPKPRQVCVVHSAAGGVGSMLVQLLKIRDCIVIGVVGKEHKVQYAKELGCDLVIDKSNQDLWSTAVEYAGNCIDKQTKKPRNEIGIKGFNVIFDANGVSTMQDGYNNLTEGGKLVIYGFHSTLPRKSGIISVLKWIKMTWDYVKMPKFNPFDMVPSNKSILAFNLSFLFREIETMTTAMNELLGYVKEGKLKVRKVT